jgi:hypothetical protein
MDIFAELILPFAILFAILASGSFIIRDILLPFPCLCRSLECAKYRRHKGIESSWPKSRIWRRLRAIEVIAIKLFIVSENRGEKL